MKYNLGKFLIVCLIIQTIIFADEDFSYKFNIPSTIKTDLKSPIYLEFEIKQLKYDGKIIFFKFNPIENNDFDIHFLKIKEVNKPNNKHIVYSYLIYPKKKGKKKVEFSLFVQKTNEDGLKPGYEGDRDNVLAMVSKDSYQDIEPLVVEVINKSKDQKLFGDFKLEYKINQKSVKAYEPVYITYTLSGKGYDPKITDLFSKNDKYEYFLDKPIKKVTHSKNGTQIKYIYKYAFLSSKNFTIPEVNIDTLVTSKINIEIKKTNKGILIDKQTSPVSSKEIYESYFEYFIYILIFISGFITAKILSIKKIFFLKKEEKKIEKPEDIKDLKKRLLWMINKDKNLYQKEIDELSLKLF